MSIYTRLAYQLSKEDFKLVQKEVRNWAEEQSKEFSDSVFVQKEPNEAYKQALNHLIHSLSDQELRI